MPQTQRKHCPLQASAECESEDGEAREEGLHYMLQPRCLSDSIEPSIRDNCREQSELPSGRERIKWNQNYSLSVFQWNSWKCCE